MNRLTALLCITLLSLTIINAQTSDGKTEYLKWKKQVSGTLQDYGHLYTFRVAIALRKIDSTHADVSVAIVGRTPNYYFIIQPIQALQFFDTDVEQNKTGKSAEWGAGQDTKNPRLGYLLDFDKTIEYEQNTNAVLVAIKPVPNKSQPVETTVLKAIFPLDEKWHFEEKQFFVPITQPKEPAPNNSLQVSRDCVSFIKSDSLTLLLLARPPEL